MYKQVKKHNEQSGKKARNSRSSSMFLYNRTYCTNQKTDILAEQNSSDTNSEVGCKFNSNFMTKRKRTENTMERHLSILNFRLPQDIFQTVKVAKILLLLEKGKGEQFKGKNLSEIVLEQEIYYSSESEDELDNSLPLSGRILNHVAAASSLQNTTLEESNETVPEEKNNVISSPFPQSDKNPWYDEEEINLNLDEERLDQKRKREQINKKSLVGKRNNNKRNTRYDENEATEPLNESSKCGCHRWTATEERLVINYFKSHITKKLAPKKHGCEQLIAQHKDSFGGVNLVLIKTLVYSSYRQK
ncbi:hypothetical protein QE152_g30639 [Popillia japonica]|uniref:Uncharacterized protein n=1 Tax=Popillia japonica TaxID=7064 RepID=A0AAW1JDX0_POPJA